MPKPRALQFTNSDRATEYVHEMYRESWHVDGLAKNAILDSR